MNKISVSLVSILLLSAILPTAGGAIPQFSDKEAPQAQRVSEDALIERTLRTRGTEYVLRVNTSNHTVHVSASHFAENQTYSGYAVSLNGRDIIDKPWKASQGETIQSQSSLIYKYYAGSVRQNITLQTYGSSLQITYNFTVPRKHNGRFLRPTVTDIRFEYLNRTHGRISVTARSDSLYRYPAYARIWTPNTQSKVLYLHVGGDTNETVESVVVPIKRGRSFEGEILLYATRLNESRPLNAKWEFFGRPGNSQLSHVPFEPISRERVSEYTYVNESPAESGGFGVTGDEYRRVLGVVGVVLLLVVVLGVLWGRRQRRV